MKNFVMLFGDVFRSRN